MVGSEGIFTLGARTVAGANGLPDGRLYEQVTPTNKAGHVPKPTAANAAPAADAAANGEALLFYGGAMGNATAGFEELALVSRHSTEDG